MFSREKTPSLLEIVLFVLEPVPLLGQRLDLLQHLFRVELEAVGLLCLRIEPRVKHRNLQKNLIIPQQFAKPTTS